VIAFDSPPVITRSLTVATVAVALAVATVAMAPTAAATPPAIPSEATARSELAALVVRDQGSMAGYSRDRFPHWNDQGGGCDTRDVVLQRDGTGVNACPVTSGSWTSPYDGATWTSDADVDIDHVVPLAEAWRTGAADWDDARRSAFANDLDGPQLIAVTDSVNQEKGDQTPDEWRPPLESFWCTYARMWIRDKTNWGLSVAAAERDALTDMLDRC
jgi:hypothetical protein